MIEIFLNSYSGKKYSAFAIILKKGNYLHKKAMPLKNVTKNEAEVIGLEYALSSIKEGFRNEDVSVYVTNSYLLKVLMQDDDGNWRITPKKNVETIDSLRE